MRDVKVGFRGKKILLSVRDLSKNEMARGLMLRGKNSDNLLFGFMVSYGFFAQFQGYGYPELDQLIENAFKELDPAVQQDMYYELQQRYYDDAPSIMLCQPLGRRYFTKYIHGFYFNPMFCGLPGPLYYMSKSES